ncbi:MAG: AraC family transcriptional regulator [Halioglobus sp.]|nr:AraC family transcriptional regulator [Halioglobus sp.]
MSNNPAPDTFEVIHARILRFFPDLVTELSGDPAYCLNKAGVDPNILVADQPSVTYRQLANLLAFAADELHCPDFGMRLAEQQRGTAMFGPLGQVMQSSTTFGEALDYVCSHNYAHSLAARVRLKHLPSEEKVFIAHDILLDGIPNRSQVMEQLLLVGHLAALEMTGGTARARCVYFRHQPVSAPKTYRHYFGCRVMFDQDEDGLVFSRQDLARPIIDPNAHILEEMVTFIDKNFTRRTPPTHAEVRGIIMRQLGIGDCSNQAVAKGLNLHLRTLHRRLSAEGTSFQQVKEQVRKDVMLYYLQQTDIELSRISERLGFAEQSIMSRQCKRWFRASPTQVRLQGRRASKVR